MVLGLAACQTEPEGLNVNVGGEVDTVVSVSLPEATRATSDVGFNIADTSDNYEVRYILEIYLGENCQRHIKVADGASVAFPVRLAPGRDYTFVAWADIVEKNNDRKEMEKDRYYNTQNGLDQKYQKDSAHPNAEAYTKIMEPTVLKAINKLLKTKHNYIATVDATKK